GGGLAGAGAAVGLLLVADRPVRGGVHAGLRLPQGQAVDPGAQRRAGHDGGAAAAARQAGPARARRPGGGTRRQTDGPPGKLSALIVAKVAARAANQAQAASHSHATGRKGGTARAVLAVAVYIWLPHSQAGARIVSGGGW